MSNLQFEDDLGVNKYGNHIPKKGLSDFLLDKGIVKDRNTANLVLLIFSIVLIIIAIFIFRKTLIGQSPENFENNTETPELDVPFGRS